MFRLALGRLKQSRLHAVNQAALVWALFGGQVSAGQLGQFVETGSLDETTEVLRASPQALEKLFAEMEARNHGQPG